MSERNPDSAEARALLREWLTYTGLRHRAFWPDRDHDDDEYASGRSLVTRTDRWLKEYEQEG